MKAFSLSHRERVKLALEHKNTDRIPIAMVCGGLTEPAHDDLEKYLQQTRGIGVTEYLRPLVDVVPVGPTYIGPELQEGEDIWGVRRKPVSYGRAAYDEIEYYPLGKIESVEELANHQWPSTDWFNYDTLTDDIKQLNSDEEYCLIVGGGNPFESAWYMRGFEQTFMDMAISPELTEFIMDKVTTFFIEHTRKTLEAAKGKVDLVFTADDIGGQEGLLMSLGMWRSHIKPHHQRLNALIHSFGAKAIYHTDGAVMPAVSDLIDMGIDILQALQFDAKGMDPVALKNQFGDQLCFEGGVSVQKTLPFGTVEDVRQEVRDRIAVLGRNGGYLLGPSHAIQAGTPPENIMAMFDTASNSK